MSGGWWTRQDGSPRWIDEEPRKPWEPTVKPLPPDLSDSIERIESTSDDEAWTPPADFTAASIVSFVQDVCGMQPWPAQAALLSEIYNDGIRESWLRLGRRSGKDRSASWIATYEATANADTHRAHVPPGELVGIAVVANSKKQARIILGWCRSYLRSEGLAHLIVRDADDEIELSNGMVIVAMPCTARSTRGYALAVVIFDEAAWYVDIDGSPMSGDELWQALVPSTAQFPDGKVLVLSTPRWSSGWFADKCRQAASGEFAGTRHWWAFTRVMNPKITDAFLESERAKDPAAFLREYEARFESGVGAALDGALIHAAVRKGVPTLNPSPQYGYVVSIDPAYRGDTFALTVGHHEGYGPATRLVIDLSRGWTGSKVAPLDHRAVLDDVAVIARSYGNAPVVLDQFAQEPVAQGLAERKVRALRRPWTNESKAEALGVMREYLFTDRLSLPDHAPLVSQLASLERTILPSGKPKIAAPGGQHDDYAMACLALIHELHSMPRSRPGEEFSSVA